MDLNFRSIRQDYNKKGLTGKDIPSNPFLLFEQWLNEAVEAEVNEPTAMVIATVGENNSPSTRTVLLKELRENEFVFYTNYSSRKGQQLDRNSSISLTFIWHELERQIHIEGEANKIAAKISDEYFYSRPRESQIGARVSKQSRPIENREELMNALKRESDKWRNHKIDRPQHWGGYSVKANRIEFWQGRPSRLHDRFVFEKMDDNQWTKTRLAP